MKDGTSETGSFFTYLIIFLFLLFVSLIGSVAGILISYSKMLPDIDSLSETKPSETTIIYDKDGNVIGKLFIENRTLVPLAEIPENLQLAIIAVEDAKFYEHKGVDIYGMVRALIENIRAKRITQGGSTITQQLAKNLFLTHRRTIVRKIQEVLLAFQLERKYSKEEILELYLNQIYFGSGAYGVEAASNVYFNKSVKDLNLAECALLAGIPRSPVNYSPFNNLALAKMRQKFVLERMLEIGFITEEEKEKAEKTPILLAKPHLYTPFDFRAPYFTSYVVEKLIDEFGANFVYRGGLRVYTTLDLRMQEIADKVIKTGIAEALKSGLNTHQAALVAIEPSTGYIRAMVGGVDFKTSQFNRAWQAKRQPGSAFKPFVYLTALEHGYSPNKIMIDEPVSYPMGRGKYWRPKNYGGGYRGPVSLRKALAHSINTIAVKLLKEVGPEEVISTAQRLGITTLDRIKDCNLATALGGITYGVTPLEMAGAFSVLANEGIKCKPIAITKITYRNGLVIKEYKPECEEVVEREIALLLTDMMKDVIRYGTGTRANIQREAAGKTGTTSDWKDAWFIGFTPDLCCAIWVGNDDNTPTRKVVGGTLPAKMWANFMRKALQNYPESYFSHPASDFIKEVFRTTEKEFSEEREKHLEETVELEICKESGKIATSYCPEIMVKKFKKKEAPKSNCPIHKEVREDLELVEVDICKQSGKLATPYCPEVITKKLPRGKIPQEICDIHKEE